MQLHWRPFDKANLQRNVQLINKTNQFNLTTKRYSQEEVEPVDKEEVAICSNPDRFVDNALLQFDQRSAIENAVLDTC